MLEKSECAVSRKAHTFFFFYGMFIREEFHSRSATIVALYEKADYSDIYLAYIRKY